MNRSVFSKARYMNGVGFEILARTPVPKLPPPPPPPHENPVLLIHLICCRWATDLNNSVGFLLYPFSYIFYICCVLLSILICSVKNYTERKKKRRVNFIPKFHSSLKNFVKYFTMITKRYMYGTKVPNFIGL